MEKAELKTQLLKLLKEDEEFRYAVAGLIGLADTIKEIRTLQKQVAENTKATKNLQEQVRDLQKQVRSLQEEVRNLQEQVRDLQKQVRNLQEQVRDLQEQVRDLQKQVRSLQEQVRSLQEQVAENTRAIRSLQEQVAENTRTIRSLQEQVAENTKAIRSLQEQVAFHAEVLERHGDRIEDLARTIQALGARWGLLAEDAFREGMRGVVEGYFGGRVERWVCHDEEGVVFGRPAVIEVDVVLRDREHILVEVKSSISRADVYQLWRTAKLYERKVGTKPKLVIISPFISDRAGEDAKKLNIRVYTTTKLR